MVLVMFEVEYRRSYAAAVPELASFPGAVQVRVAEVVVMEEAASEAVVAGGVVSAATVVVKVLSPEVARLPEASLDLTR